MGKLFEVGHVIELLEDDFKGCPGKTWYQVHFKANTSGKFQVILTAPLAIKKKKN